MYIAYDPQILLFAYITKNIFMCVLEDFCKSF